jgi:triacylglycerol esterase/lipase EstA (alpha/beta hydrolase family)
METKQPEHSEHSYNYVQALPVLRGLLISRRACTLKCDKEPQSGAPIFVLVHGTWATRASWTLPDSKLRKKLESSWPEGGIYRFDWSGTNGVRHRLLASGVLSEKLNELVVRYPSSKVVVISHSHGGNVVAWASNRLKRR